MKKIIPFPAAIQKSPSSFSLPWLSLKTMAVFGLLLLQAVSAAAARIEQCDADRQHECGLQPYDFSGPQANCIGYALSQLEHPNTLPGTLRWPAFSAVRKAVVDTHLRENFKPQIVDVKTINSHFMDLEPGQKLIFASEKNGEYIHFMTIEKIGIHHVSGNGLFRVCQKMNLLEPTCPEEPYFIGYSSDMLLRLISPDRPSETPKAASASPINTIFLPVLHPKKPVFTGIETVNVKQMLTEIMQCPVSTYSLSEAQPCSVKILDKVVAWVAFHNTETVDHFVHELESNMMKKTKFPKGSFNMESILAMKRSSRQDYNKMMLHLQVRAVTLQSYSSERSIDAAWDLHKWTLCEDPYNTFGFTERYAGKSGLSAEQQTYIILARYMMLNHAWAVWMNANTSLDEQEQGKALSLRAMHLREILKIIKSEKIKNAFFEREVVTRLERVKVKLSFLTVSSDTDKMAKREFRKYKKAFDDPNTPVSLRISESKKKLSIRLG